MKKTEFVEILKKKLTFVFVEEGNLSACVGLRGIMSSIPRHHYVIRTGDRVSSNIAEPGKPAIIVLVGDVSVPREFGASKAERLTLDVETWMIPPGPRYASLPESLEKFRLKLIKDGFEIFHFAVGSPADPELLESARQKLKSKSDAVPIDEEFLAFYAQLNGVQIHAAKVASCADPDDLRERMAGRLEGWAGIEAFPRWNFPGDNVGKKRSFVSFWIPSLEYILSGSEDFGPESETGEVPCLIYADQTSNYFGLMGASEWAPYFDDNSLDEALGTFRWRVVHGHDHGADTNRDEETLAFYQHVRRVFGLWGMDPAPDWDLPVD